MANKYRRKYNQLFDKFMKMTAGEITLEIWGGEKGLTEKDYKHYYQLLKITYKDIHKTFYPDYKK